MDAWLEAHSGWEAVPREVDEDDRSDDDENEDDTTSGHSNNNNNDENKDKNDGNSTGENGEKSEAAITQIEDDEYHANDDKKANFFGIAHRNREKVTKQASILIGGTLKQYQLHGLEWLVSLYNNNLNGILADEMGLGKTIQTIALITYLMECKKVNGPFLIIVPLSTLSNWVNEFARWAPSVICIIYKGDPNQRRNLSMLLKNGKFNVLLTTYEYIIRDKAALAKVIFNFVKN